MPEKQSSPRTKDFRFVGAKIKPEIHAALVAWAHDNGISVSAALNLLLAAKFGPSAKAEAVVGVTTKAK